MKKSGFIGHKVKHAIRLDRAISFVWKAGPGWVVAGGLLLVVQGMLPLLALYIMKLIIDGVTSSLPAPDKMVVFRHVAFFIGCGFGVALLNSLCQTMSGLVKEAQTLKVSEYVYRMLHAKSVEVDLEYYENPQYFDTLHRAQAEGPFRPTSIVEGLMRLGQSGVSLVAMAGLLVSFHWIICVVLFAAVVPGILVRLKYSNIIYHWRRQRTKSERKADYYNWMLTGSQYAKEIRLFGLGSLFSERFNVLRTKIRTEKFDIEKRRSAADFLVQAFATLSLFGSLGFIAFRCISGVISLGDMVMFFQAFQRGLGYLKELLGSIAGLYEDNLFITNFYEFLDIKPQIKTPEKPCTVPNPMEKGIVLEHVSFRYPEGKRNALEDVSLSIMPGEVVAFVGENGSGKTTLVKLLCRLYDPTGGVITMDGIDLKKFDPNELRRQFGIIFQDFAQYHLTALENIWLGNIELSPDKRLIADAAKYAGADDLIRGLPEGYETMLGKWFENGEELSGGQWQKIALARAFLRDAGLIVLDEPTSSLDPNSEFQLFTKFRQLLKGRSAVLISHRFSTVLMADRIFVLEKGRIIESGSHDQLIQKGGKYSLMFERQAKHYRN